MEQNIKLMFEKGSGGQYEILQYLKQSGEQRLTCRQIANALNVSISSVQRNIRKINKRLINYQEVEGTGRTPIKVYWTSR